MEMKEPKLMGQLLKLELAADARAAGDATRAFQAQVRQAGSQAGGGAIAGGPAPVTGASLTRSRGPSGRIGSASSCRAAVRLPRRGGHAALPACTPLDTLLPPLPADVWRQHGAADGAAAAV